MPVMGNSPSTHQVSFRIAGLQLPELDRDVPPASALRQRVVAIVNLRPKYRVPVTSKRSLKDGLHDVAIFEAGSLLFHFAKR